MDNVRRVLFVFQILVFVLSLEHEWNEPLRERVTDLQNELNKGGVKP